MDHRAGWRCCCGQSGLGADAPWEKDLYEAAKKEKAFTVYTAHYNTETAQNLCAAFEKKYPGLKCNFVRTTAQVAYQRFQQDLQANAPVASVFSSTDVSHYPDLKKHGLLMHYKPHNLAEHGRLAQAVQRQGRLLLRSRPRRWC